MTNCRSDCVPHYIYIYIYDRGRCGARCHWYIFLFKVFFDFISVRFPFCRTCAILKGMFPPNELLKTLEKFITMFILCPNCKVGGPCCYPCWFCFACFDAFVFFLFIPGFSSLHSFYIFFPYTNIYMVSFTQPSFYSFHIFLFPTFVVVVSHSFQKRVYPSRRSRCLLVVRHAALRDPSTMDTA